MNWSDRRGPFRFQVTRSTTGKQKVRSEWLPGTIPAWDVEEELQALITDPRDTIVSVNIWSARDQQLVMTVRR